ncbi:uncharacterized protein EV420DRAFT_1652807 [Desarmillaria tabescens]|uniref:F-box domain-containing protein n=1 Tax=Armillaria tabescens TaxID=1929756 RepID=A0AA39MJQ0_ARMTA|nr:uncharacterized protein EV420DRAFT_1652807 [Desarmillaria tabescens]KAK0435950.1 hypothetical protein EV420DRAFT_1652807 [Desarmillaria tabescens]
MSRDIYPPSSESRLSLSTSTSGPEATSLAAPTERPTPIHGVPLDVLEEIFTNLINSLVLAVDDYRGDRFHSSMLTISHVCVYWRDVSYSLASLWSFIFVPVRYLISRGEHCREHRDVDISIPPALINVYLRRSKNYPLSLFLFRKHDGMRRKGSRSTQNYTSATITSLRTQAHRWRELYISSIPLTFQDFPKLFTGLGNLTSLERLTCVKPFDIWKFRAFTTAPNLHWLDLGEYVRPGNISSPFPYAQISHLILRSLDFQSTSLFPNITDVTMYGTPPRHFLSPSPDLTSNIVSLTICLTYFTQEHLPLYRRDISLPRLRDLTIIYVGPVRNPFKAEYLTQDLITVFSHQIQHLTLWRVPICVEDLITILEFLIELRHLGVHDPLPPVYRPYCPISRELIRRLATDPLFLPHVNSLDLKWQWDDVDEGMVMDMLLYRTGSTGFAKPYVPPSYLNSLIEQMRCWVV